MNRTEQLQEARRRIDGGEVVSRIIPRQTRVPLSCVHLGAATGESVQCPSCNGNVQVNLFKCAKHGTCTVTKKVPDHATCSTCPDRLLERNTPLLALNTDRNALHSLATHPIHSSLSTYKKPYGPIGLKHLIYHVLPVHGNGVWRKGLRQLVQRWHLFTGRKVICVATGGTTHERIDPTEKVGTKARALLIDNVHTVKAALPSDAEVIEVRNDPNLWELVSWPILWREILSTANDSDAVFYAHAKGVTRKLTSPCHVWTDLLYTLNLDYPHLVNRLMEVEGKPVVGSLVKWGRFFGGNMIASRWHYSGNFHWTRAGAVRERLEKFPVPINAWGCESWTGIAFAPEECGVVFTPKVKIDHLYKPDSLDKVVEEFDRWCALNPSQVYTNSPLQLTHSPR